TTATGWWSVAENLNSLERYLTGLPLSEDNAALQAGREPVTEPISEDRAKHSSLSDDEKEWLRRLINEPGFTVLLKVLNSSVQKREDGAKVLSSNNPLGNAQEIATEWAYIAIYRQVLVEIQNTVRNAQAQN